MAAAADDARPEAAGALAEERVWMVVPACTGRFSVFEAQCVLLPLAAAWLALSSSLSTTALALGIGVIGAIQIGVLGIELFFPSPGNVGMGPAGVQVGKRLIPWERITRIGNLAAGAMVIAYGRRRVRLPPYPVVLKEVVPEILRRLPGVKVSRRARRAIENPDSALRGHPWMILIPGTALAMLPLFARLAAPWWIYGAFPAVLGFVLPMPVLGRPWPNADPEGPKLGALLLYAIFLPLAYTLVLFLEVPLRSMDSLAAMVSILYLFVVAAAAFDWKPRALTKGAVLCLAVAVPLAVYYAERPFDLKRTEITSLLGPGLHSDPLTWSPDGRWMMVDTSGEKPALVDRIAQQGTDLPGHKQRGMVLGVGSTVAVRSVYSGSGRARDLLLYRFGDRREVELSTGMKNGVTWGRCISPGGGLVCWLERPDSNEPHPSSLMVHDVRAGATRSVDVVWPDGNDIDWQACWWIDDQKIAVRGQNPRRDWNTDGNGLTSLHVLRVEYPSGSTQHVAPSEQFREWVLSPDARHAFVYGSQEDANRQDVWYMDIPSGQKTSLEGRPVFQYGSSVPCWQLDGRAAWRVADFQAEGVWLCRFQVDRAKEERVLRIPPGDLLRSVSPRGRFAILYDGDIRVRPLRLVQLATGSEIRFDASLSAAIGIMNDWRPGEAGRPWMGQWSSIWSPDETRFAVPSSFWRIRFKDFPLRLFLYEVPPAWLE